MFLFRHLFRRHTRHIWILPHSLQFPSKIVRIFKVPINTGKPNVCHLIELPKIVHHLLADVLAFNFGLKCCADVMLDLGNQCLNLLIADFPFPAGAFDSMLESFSLKGDAGAISFDDPDLRCLDSFVGREFFSADTTLPPPPYNEPIRTGSRVGNLVIILIAKWTTHCEES